MPPYTARLILATFAAALLLALSGHARAQATETQCTDGVDEDGDTVTDCGDADCAQDPACQADGSPENTDARCSDWIDNDENGYTDCDDTLCQNQPSCQGSWAGKSSPAGGDASYVDEDIPELGEGMTVEDLIGQAGDNDGERNDVDCSDGIDNDNDGRTDCADFGCRFDRTVTVCQGDPDFRFSVVARLAQTNQLEYPDKGSNDGVLSDARFSALQLRAFGPLPFLQDSFFLLSTRFEKTPRLTFAMFQVPLGKKGHYLNVNSGSGGLSNALTLSAHKRLLLDPPFYVYNAFEQGNGAAVEVGGPIDAAGRFLFRTYVSGGTGRFSGSVGGGFVSDDTTNFAYSAGAQVRANIIGYFSRWDSPMLYTPLPAALAVAIGGKYDQRTLERYPAANAQVVFRYLRFILMGETYFKRELEFKQNQIAYNIQAGFLVWAKRMMIAGDFGEYVVGDFESMPSEDLRTQQQETQWRAAVHVFLWKNILQGSVLYVDRRLDPAMEGGPDQVTRELNAVAQYRF